MNSSEPPSGYQVVIYPKVAKSLSVLPKSTQSKIKSSLRKIELGAGLPRVKPLTGSWAGCFSWRFGVYRVIFEVDHTEKAMIVVRVGHRSKVYN